MRAISISSCLCYQTVVCFYWCIKFKYVYRYPPGSLHIPPQKRKIIFKHALGKDMLVPRRVYIHCEKHRLAQLSCRNNGPFLNHKKG